MLQVHARILTGLVSICLVMAAVAMGGQAAWGAESLVFRNREIKIVQRDQWGYDNGSGYIWRGDVVNTADNWNWAYAPMGNPGGTPISRFEEMNWWWGGQMTRIAKYYDDGDMLVAVNSDEILAKEGRREAYLEAYMDVWAYCAPSYQEGTPIDFSVKITSAGGTPGFPGLPYELGYLRVNHDAPYLYYDYSYKDTEGSWQYFSSDRYGYDDTGLTAISAARQQLREAPVIWARNYRFSYQYGEYGADHGFGPDPQGLGPLERIGTGASNRYKIYIPSLIDLLFNSNGISTVTMTLDPSVDTSDSDNKRGQMVAYPDDSRYPIIYRLTPWNISIKPEVSSEQVGGLVWLTVSVLEKTSSGDVAPVPNASVDVSVLDGVNYGVSITGRTDDNGELKVALQSGGLRGTDWVWAVARDFTNVRSNFAEITWTGDVSVVPVDQLPREAGFIMCPSAVAQSSTLQSKVENPILSHIHDATDYSVAGVDGCGSCGGSMVAGDRGDAVEAALKRIHRYVDQSRPGTFGPGVFCNFDIHLTLWNGGEVGEIWDPSATSPIPLTALGGGAYADQKRSAIKGCRLLAADGTAASTMADAVTAVADLHDGGAWVFELVQAGLGGDLDRHGRLIAIRDRAGNQATVTYAFPATANDADLGGLRPRLLEMAAATDQRGRRIAFTYTWTCGQPVVSTVTTPAGAVIRYFYDGDIAGVCRIAYPDGTESTFTLREDPATQTMVVQYRDAGAEGTHRTKDVYLTLDSWQPADASQPRVPQPCNRVRRVVGATGEVTYLNWLKRDGANVQIYVFEGGGVAGQGRMLRLDTIEGVTQTTWVASNWSFATDPSTWTWARLGDYEADAQFRMGAQVDPLGGRTVYERDPASGAITGRTRTTADGTVLSRESTMYNSMRLPTRQVDANGVITTSAYDAAGNLLSRTEGITRTQDGSDDLTQAVTWQWTYRPDGQVLTQTDPLGRVTVSEYDERGFKVAEVTPGDKPGDPALRRTWHFDAAGRLDQSTDAAGHTVCYAFDSRNRLTTTTYADGSAETVTYGQGADANLVIARTDRNGHRTDFGYDAAGREIARTEGADDPAVAVTTATTYLEGTDLPLTVTRAGQTTRYQYDTRKRQVAVTTVFGDGREQSERTVYDAADRVAYTEDAFARRTYSVYDGLDRVTRTIRESTPGGVPADSDLATLPRLAGGNPAYVVEETSYDAGGRVLTTTDGRGVTTAFTYDNHGRVLTRTEAAGTAVAATWEYRYDALGNRVAEIDPLQRTKTWTYTQRNLVASETIAAGTAEAATSAFTYTATGQRATMTDALGRTVTSLYGGCCDRLTAVQDALGFTTAYTYLAGGQVESVTDANGHVTTTRYDALNRPVQVTDAAGATTTTTYDQNLTDGLGLDAQFVEIWSLADHASCTATAVTTPTSETTVRIADARGRVRMVIDPRRKITTSSYDQMEVLADGRAVTAVIQADPTGSVTKVWSDGLGRVVGQQMPPATSAGMVVVVSLAYDSNSNRLSARDANGVGEDVQFDERNRPTVVSDTAGSTTRTTFDALGNVLTRVDGLGATTTFTYTARNQKQTETDRLGHVTRFAYDLAGNLVAISDAENEARKATVDQAAYEAGMTRYTYSARNELLTETFPGPTGGTRSYTYDPAGRLHTRTDQRGITTTYSYDAANRLTGRTYSDGTADSFTLDAAGRILTALAGRSGVKVERAYTSGLLVSETLRWLVGQDGAPQTTTVNYAHDDVGRVKTVTYSDGRTLERTFTPRGQVEGLTFGGAQVATLARDAGGRRTGTAFANGLTDTRTYRADNRLAGTSVAPTAGGEAQLALGYSYDANKRKTAEADIRKPAQSQSFGYDAQDRMTDWRLSDAADPDGSHQTWTVSPVGDWKETSRDGLPEMRSHTQVHEISAINGQALAHDAAGNLTVSEKGQRFVWDAENRLIEATSAPNKDGVHGTVRYLTDALGRRVARTARGSTTLYVYDGAQVIQEITVPHILPPSAAEDDGALANLATVPDGAILMPTWDAEGNRHDVTRINFQPERTEIPAGFIADKGKDYALRSNTLTYGWTAPEGTPSRDPALIRRFHPMPQYDTTSPMGSGWTWQVALANGSYPVIVVLGDATSRHHTNNVVVQGQAQSDPDPYDAAETQSYLKGDFDGYAVQATVTDGVLKIEVGADAIEPTICFVEVGPEGMQLTDEMKKRLADEVEAATQRTGGKPYGKGNDVEVKSLVYSGDYIDEPLMVEAKSGRYFIHGNQQYSVMAISNAAGEVVERRQYGPYGEIEVNEEGVPPVELSVGYTGREWDADVGLYYFRARWYSPRLGRFVNRDPLTYVDGMSMYAAYFAPGGLDPDGNKIKVAMTGAGDVLPATWNGAADVAPFSSRDVEGAVTYIIGRMDKNKDGKVDCQDGDPEDVRVIGYSWGGWSAVQIGWELADKVKDSGLSKNPRYLKLGLLDPVSTIRPGRNSLSPNVAYALNLFERNSSFDPPLAGISFLFRGEPISGAYNQDVSKDPKYDAINTQRIEDYRKTNPNAPFHPLTRFAPDHIDMHSDRIEPRYPVQILFIFFL